MQQTPIEIRALASPAFLDRGCVNVIDIHDIKAHAGERWDRIRSNVYDRIETLLRNRLGPADFFARIDETQYLVTMPSAEPEDINIICIRVAYDLYTNLMGQCDVNKIAVSKAVHAGQNMMSLVPLPTAKMSVLVEKAGFDKPGNDIPGGGTTADGKNDSMHPQDDPEDPFLKSAVNQTVNVMEGQEERTKTLTIVHQFMPLWSVVNKAITTYICEPRQIMTLDIPRRHIPMQQLSLKERIRIELTTLREGVNKLSRNIEAGNRFILALQVSFDVIGSPTGRMEFIAECRNFSNEYRHYLDFIITDVPQGVAHTRLNDLTNTLRPFARSVSATIPPGTQSLGAYQGVGLRSIGFAQGELQNESLIHRDMMTNLVKNARAVRLSTFCVGVRKMATLQKAYEAGIQMLSGPALSPATPTPKGMTRLSWEEIISSREMLSS